MGESLEALAEEAGPAASHSLSAAVHELGLGALALKEVPPPPPPSFHLLPLLGLACPACCAPAAIVLTLSGNAGGTILTSLAAHNFSTSLHGTKYVRGSTCMVFACAKGRSRHVLPTSAPEKARPESELDKACAQCVLVLLGLTTYL